MDAAWNEEIARTFRRRSGQDRRRIFGKTDIFHPATRFLDDLRALDDVGVKRFTAQVEEAVFQSDFLRIFLLARDWQRQFVSTAQHRHIACENLDFASRQVGVDGRRAARLHLAIDGYNALKAQSFEYRERGAVAVRDDLRHAVMIAQVDEQYAAMVALAVYPARQAYGFTDVRSAQFRAFM